MELLAPAGSRQALTAAVQSGADAVYLGGPQFGARYSAENFTIEEMKTWVDYCHLYGVDVHVTVNTLVKEKEIESLKEYLKQLNEIGVDALPNFPKDATDRNRTSPFAFTGNKFEFRMLGSADSISCTNVMMNTIVAQVLSEFADELEKADDFKSALKKLLVKTIKEHKRVIFNGNGYSDEWIDEAINRGLPNLVSTVDALPHYTDEKYVSMFEKFKVYSKTEIESRKEILLENYSKVINIEALTMLDMAKKLIAPAALEYTKIMCDSVVSKENAGIDSSLEKSLANKLSGLTASLYEAIDTLDSKRIASKDHEDSAESLARYYRDEVFADMQNLRAIADELEMNVPEKYWPIPTYTDLLFTV